jgi:hypothetical protein
VRYGRLTGDLVGDGEVTAADALLEAGMRVWQQEQTGAPWHPLGTIKDLDQAEIRAPVPSFTGFVIAA